MKQQSNKNRNWEATLKHLLVSFLGFVLLSISLSAPRAASNKLVTAGSDNGASIYSGQLVVPAYMVGHQSPIPPLASKCSNCHKPDDKQIALAPKINAQELMGLKSRRGGPPTRFDAVSLCKLLREGIDPASVVINTSMPRYQMSDQQCSALWSYLAKAQ